MKRVWQLSQGCLVAKRKVITLKFDGFEVDFKDSFVVVWALFFKLYYYPFHNWQELSLINNFFESNSILFDWPLCCSNLCYGRH